MVAVVIMLLVVIFAIIPAIGSSINIVMDGYRP